MSGLESDIASAAAQPLDITADTTGLESDITTAIGDANTVVPVEGDTTALASDIESASAQPVELNIDTGAVTGDITAAIADVSAPVVVEGDTSALDSAIADALDQPRPPLLVEGDTTELTDAIDSATTGLSTTIPLDGDTSRLSDAIDGVIAALVTLQVAADVSAAQDSINSLTETPVELPVVADTTQAQDAIDQLSTSATAGGSSLDSLSGGVEALKATTGAATGELGSLEGVIANISPATASATAGIAAFAGFIATTTSLAADAQAQNKRFADTFGALADAVESINVGGLNISLTDLGKESGTSRANLEAVASRIGTLGQTSGASAPQIVKVTDNLLALGATIAVNNPRLGDAADVTDKLTGALARGGRALAPFGIALTSAQINAEALKETGKATASELTSFEKSAAGATLALQGFGNTLGDKFAAGTANAEVQLRALKVQIEETLVALGGPLLQPLVTSLQELLPVAESVGQVLGELAQIALPLLTTLGPPLAVLADGLGLAADGIAALHDEFRGINGPTVVAAAAIGLLGAAMAASVTPAIALGAAVEFALGPIGLTIGALSALAAIGAFQHFHDQTQQVVVDTTTLSNAFEAVGPGGDALIGTFARVNAALDTFLNKQLTVGASGSQAIDALNGLGVSTDHLKDILTGSSAAFDAFDLSVINSLSTAKTVEQVDAWNQLETVLTTTRASLEANAGATLKTAVSTGVLTAANAGGKKVIDQINGGWGDQLALLKQLTPALNDAAHAQQLSADAQFVGSGQAKELQQQVASGTVTLKDAAAAATSYGISQELANQIIVDTIAAHDQAATATALHSRAFQELIDDIATGAVSIPDATAKLRDMGFSMDGAATAASALASGVSSAVDSIVSNLPSASDAFKAWSDGTGDLFKKLAGNVTTGVGDIKAEFAALVADTDPQVFFDNLVRQSFQVAAFEANIQKLIHEGLGGVAGFLATQDIQFAAPFAAKLAADPGNAKVRESIFEIFRSATGPEAQAFFNQRAAELGIPFGTVLGNGIVVGAPVVNAAVEQVSAGLAAHFHPEFTGRISTSVNAAAAALASDPTIGQAAGQKGLETLRAFEATYGPTDSATAAKVALAGARQAIDDDPTLATASGKKGKQTGDKFKPDFVSGITAALGSGQEAISAQTVIQSKAAILGISVGENFASGIQNGLTDPKSIAAVESGATSLASHIPAPIKKLLGITSPSRVGVEIGQQFVAGIEIGLSDNASITRTGTEIVSALTGSTSVAFAAAGRTAVNQIVAGFNDPATVAAAIATLKQLVAQATATATNTGQATTQFSSFVSSVISQLPAGASAISNFGQTISSDLSAQSSALDGVHKAYTAYHEDLAKSRRLAHDAGIAYGVLVVAQQRLNAAVAAHAPKNVIAELTDSLKAAQSNLDSLSNKLDSARSRVSSDQSNIADSTKQLHDASHQLATDTNPETFIKNLNAQTAANRAFQRNIAKLAREGFTDLAQQLAAAGPETAGKLAKGLASKRALAKSAEAAIDHAKAFADSFEAFLVKTFGPKVAATVATVGQHAGTAIGSDLIAITATATHTAVTNVNAQLNAVAPEIRVTVDTSSVTTGLEQIPTTAPLTVVPSLGHLAIPPFPAVTLPLTPTFGPLPPIAPLTVQVNADVAPIAEQTIEVRPDLNPPLPQFAAMRLDVIPDVGPLPSASLSVEPVLDPLPALAPISVRVIPIVDALPPGLTAALQPHLTAVAPVASVVAPAPTSQTLELDLSITIPDGTVLTATKTVTVPINRSATKTKIGAAVQAKVRA